MTGYNCLISKYRVSRRTAWVWSAVSQADYAQKCEFPLSSIHHASSNNGFSRLFERLHLTHIEYLGHWIACKKNFAGCRMWSRASKEHDNSEHCCPSPLNIRALCGFRPEIGTVQTWIMMHRICVCLHTDSMRSVLECRNDWLQLSHLEVESIEENCMSVKCSEPSWLCTKMWISIVFYSSCEFKQWILAVFWTIAFD